MKASSTPVAATPRQKATRLWAPIVVATVAWLGTHDARAVGSMVDVDVIDRDSGATLQVFPFKGSHYIAGRPGARYAIRVSNQTGGRVLAVMSVDGVNIVTGQTASWGQSGYVLEPWQTHEITGWRKSQAEVAAFEFTALPNSYAARTGRPGDVGVIGVAVFAQQPAPPPPPVPFPAPEVSRGEGRGDNRSDSRNDGRSNSLDRRESAAGASAEKAAPSSPASPSAAPAPAQDSALSSARRSQVEPASKLGTGHGAREASYAGRTTFVRSSNQPLELVSIQYDRHENLVSAGVIRDAYRNTPPSPFPRSAERGYVPDPPHW